jgi:hypothetical protein
VLRASPLLRGHLEIFDATLLRTLPILENLRSLSCRFGPRDGAGLSLLRQVDVPFAVTLSGFQSRTLDALRETAQLVELCVVESPNLTDVSDIRTLPSLTGLVFDQCDGIVDLWPLADIEQLQRCGLPYSGERFLDVQFLQSLQNLSYLDLTGWGQVTDFRPLERMESLRDLTLESCVGLSHLEFLASDVLQTLNCRDCENLSNIRALGGRDSLRWVVLAGTQVADLGPLANLVELRGVDVSGCRRLRDIAAIATLPHLKYVNVQEAALEDLSPLFTRHGLTIVVGFNIDRAGLPEEFVAANKIVFTPTGVDQDESELLLDIEPAAYQDADDAWAYAGTPERVRQLARELGIDLSTWYEDHDALDYSD